ncbi:hypothetical protein CYLTODRAFT_411671 [Cylindrobasidium torrendii FP15055 ss-10]|uniref:Uncharacterized protein n=1 Tax=Cylindrobasidium torrendii FP15055 ss-10 TaxID=1314674 RepID=A0A0D7B953_9AGAR|nr:hypothetical protein CYLTODRAFT_411671 [Cylindrobasidium torrendii FP15055 ss-10]
MDPGRLQTLLESNEPPDVDERDQVRAVLLPVRQHLADLVSRITSTQAELTRMITEQRQETIHLTRIEGILSPLRSIPDDVLAMIFEHCCYSSLDDSGEPTFADDAFPNSNSTDTSSPPWSLSQVCQNWRALAISRGHLWATVCIRDDIDGQKPATVSTQCQRVKLILLRSKECHLRIFFRGRRKPSIALFKILLDDLHRWRWAILKVDPIIVQPLHGATLPFLTHLSLRLHSVAEEHIALHTPALRFMEEIRRYRNDMIDVTWGKVTSYTCVESNLDQIERLTNATNITISDSAQIKSEHRRNPPPENPIYLDKVTTLHIHENERTLGEKSLCAYVFDRFAFTSLRILHLTFPGYIMPGMRVGAFPSTLSELTLHYVPETRLEDIDWADVVDLWKQAGSLSTLYLKIPPHLSIIDGLKTLSSDIHLLPNLITLRFVCDQAPPSSLLPTLQDVLTARSHTLRKVHLVRANGTKGEVEDAWRSEIWDMVGMPMDSWQSEKGLEVSFKLFTR